MNKYYLPLFVGIAIVLFSACENGSLKSTNPLPTSTGKMGDFTSQWAISPDRPWIGPEFWANRLQDWQIKDGRLECVESAANKPMRVAHLLSGALIAKKGGVSISVNTGLIEPGMEVEANSMSGFLIGSGGESIDYRLTALSHHRPAEDGGIFIGIGTNGQLMIRDFSGGGGGNNWSIGGPLSEENFPVIASTGLANLQWPVSLDLQINPEGSTYQIQLSALSAETGELMGELVHSGITNEQIEGSVGIVSSGGNGKGFWYQDLLVSGKKFNLFPGRAYGPVLGVQYTLSKETLKLTAQMPPLGVSDNQIAELEIMEEGAWTSVARAQLTKDSYTFPFKIEHWDDTKEYLYRISYLFNKNSEESLNTYYEGTIRKDPKDKEEIVVAGFTGNKIFTGGLKWNHDGIWFPHNELVEAIAYHDPDLMFFSGDQVYEGDLTGAQYEPYDKAVLDYLDKWYRWCWAFGGLSKDRPTICIPDDHDVYHGNIWGAGGKSRTKRSAPSWYPNKFKGHWIQDAGGYKMPVDFVNMVQRTQTSHLPDPYDPRQLGEGIDVYYTDMLYGGISFAVIEDRKWKSSPTISLPDAKVINGFIQNPRYDKTKTNNPNASLLGQRQLDFLEDWSSDWRDSWMKVVLSQTIFANVSTYPDSFETDAGTPSIKPVPFGEIPSGYALAIDMDSNGWPQAGRNRALDKIRKAYAFHIAGDQHLGSTIQYGLEEWRDAGFAVCVPSIGNTWPRRWYPPYEGNRPLPNQPPYTGDYQDGFGNYMTVHAVSNPIVSGREPANLYDRAPGYGIVRFEKKTRDITIEVWPRWVDPSVSGAEQYPGWPVKINQLDNFPHISRLQLPTLEISGMEDAVVQVEREKGELIVSTIRLNGTSYQPFVDRSGKYTIRVGNIYGGKKKTFTGIKAEENNSQVLKVEL